jgi:transcriptional regulator with XRE-family HTH domain
MRADQSSSARGDPAGGGASIAVQSMVERDDTAKPLRTQWFTAQSSTGKPLERGHTLRRMTKASSTEIQRSAYGERLLKARQHAGLSQRVLAQKAGFESQSTLSQLEISGQGSSRTARIAEICGVRVAWLDRGDGPMLDAPEEPPSAARTVASEKVAHYLVGTPGGNDYRTVALSLASALEESGMEITAKQFINLLEATYAKLKA